MNSTHSTHESAFAAAVKTGRWANPEVLERLAEAHQQQRAELWEAANRSLDHHRPRLAEALAGDAGEAMLKTHDENARLWFRHADTYATSGGALVDAISELRGLNIDLDLLIQEKEPAYNAALKHGNVVGAQDILTSSLAEADGMVTDRGARATKFVQAIDFTMPLPERPASSGQSKSPDHDKQTEKPQKPTKSSGSDGTNGTSDETSPAELKHDKQSDVPAASEAGPNSPVPSALSGHDKETAPSEPASSLPATSMMSRGNSAGGGSGSSGGVGSGMSGLGSSLKPPSGLGSPRGGMPASGAMPRSVGR